MPTLAHGIEGQCNGSSDSMKGGFRETTISKQPTSTTECVRRATTRHRLLNSATMRQKESNNVAFSSASVGCAKV
ncbi:hypothetical protein DEO72_LG4g462 [Vigna unguiculata]|uniref:Uncharacterized protein n=1 Tax=Vigna unguiculata TaxID=3917 RepID=A0A4D6LMP2_VIGUN|nr:hypothetical protein DEO72_LG4g462 [Vigna unguiculata]